MLDRVLQKLLNFSFFSDAKIVHLKTNKSTGKLDLLQRFHFSVLRPQFTFRVDFLVF